MKKYTHLLLLLLMSLATQAQDYLLPDTAFKLRLVYELNGREFEATSKGHETINNKYLAVGMSFYPAEGGRRVMASITAKQGVTLKTLEVTTDQQFQEGTKALVNGFQCWTETQEYTAEDKLKPLRPIARGIAKYYGDYTFHKYPKRKGMLHGYTYAYLRLPDGRIHLTGSLDESQGYTILQYDLQNGGTLLARDCEGKKLAQGDNYIALDLYESVGDETAAFDIYDKLARQATEKLTKSKRLGHVPPVAPNRPGWTSWYHYFHDIDEEIILSNLHAFKSRNVPIEMFQIDDGYQKSVGEWTEANEKFPNGMGYIADSIHAAGYKAGIWLAPYIVEKKSKIAEEHPDWLLKDEKGKPISAGFNPGWSGAYYGLDIYNSEVQGYLKHTLGMIFNAWKYDMIKVDFLFAAAISPPPGKTRGEVMTDAMLMLREWSGDKLILGCGVPLGPSMHLVDYCRVSSDIHMKWEQHILKWLHARERLSSWNATTTTIARRHLGGRFFGNDPDVFVLRSEKNKLKPEQKHTMFLVNNLFGNLVLHSDNIDNYDAEQMNLYLSGFPYREKEILEVQKHDDFYEVQFRIDDREYMAFINLAKGKHTVRLDGQYFNGQSGELVSGAVEVGSFESVCFYKLKQNKDFQVLGGPGYLFPGAEIKNMELLQGKHIKLHYHEGVVMPGPVTILSPEHMEIDLINGQQVETTMQGDYKLLQYQP